MSEPFLAEVRMFGFSFAPRGWAFCDGQILPINQNQSLYSLLGTTYGGDGRTSFALPDMRSRTPIHVGNGHTQGQRSGDETHTLSNVEMPQHTHALSGSSADVTSSEPAGNVPGSSTTASYNDTANGVTASDQLVSFGGGLAHNNMQPYTVITFCIALQGLFPSRN